MPDLTTGAPEHPVAALAFAVAAAVAGGVVSGLAAAFSLQRKIAAATDRLDALERERSKRDAEVAGLSDRLSARVADRPSGAGACGACPAVAAELSQLVATQLSTIREEARKAGGEEARAVREQMERERERDQSGATEVRDRVMELKGLVEGLVRGSR